jgi:hypothetical protein
MFHSTILFSIAIIIIIFIIIIAMGNRGLNRDQYCEEDAAGNDEDEEGRKRRAPFMMCIPKNAPKMEAMQGKEKP